MTSTQLTSQKLTSSWTTSAPLSDEERKQLEKLKNLARRVEQAKKSGQPDLDIDDIARDLDGMTTVSSRKTSVRQTAVTEAPPDDDDGKITTKKKSVSLF